MDLSDTRVTTRNIVATLSPDEIKSAAIGAVRLKAGVASDAEVLQAAVLNPDGGVQVKLSVTMPLQSEAAESASASTGEVPPAPTADLAPLNLAV